MHGPCFSPALRRECFGSCLKSPGKEGSFAAWPRHEFRGLAATKSRAGEGTRTLDIQLGKLALYQLSYAREQRNLSRSSRACTRGRRQPLFTAPAVAPMVAQAVTQSVAPPAATAGAGDDHVVARHPPAQPQAPPPRRHQPRRHQLRRDLPVLQTQAQAQALALAPRSPAERPAQAAGHWPPPPPHAGRDGGPLLRSARQPDRSPDRSAENRPSAAPADPSTRR